MEGQPSGDMCCFTARLPRSLNLVLHQKGSFACNVRDYRHHIVKSCISPGMILICHTTSSGLSRGGVAEVTILVASRTVFMAFGFNGLLMLGPAVWDLPPMFTIIKEMIGFFHSVRKKDDAD